MSGQGAAISGGNDVTFLDQGWDEATRAAFYQTTQGSRMLPYAWFLALEQATNKKRFAEAKNLRGMGYIVDAPSPTNPDGLPVGFARDVDPVRGDAIGLTCSACHTGELEYQGVNIRIDGGQSLADIEQFQHALVAAIEATLADPKKFRRFADAVLGTCDEAARAALRAEVEAKRDWWTARVERHRGANAHGPSRIDALGAIGNEVACYLLNIPTNCIRLNAPVQYPHLWDTPDFEWVQYTSSVHSPIGRNVGEVSGVFAENTLSPTGVISTANIPNLHALENWLKTLRSPEWPAEILGEIDMTLATKGSALYSEYCAGCHTQDPQPRSGPNTWGLTFAQVNFNTPLAQLGTDPGAALSFGPRRVDPGPWKAKLAEQQVFVGPDGKVPVLALLGLSGQLILGRFFVVNGLTDAQKLDYAGYRESRAPLVPQLLTYKARPLNGIAFTAPYLHNGSVASIYELLLPASERMTQFWVGNKEYDVEKLGYHTDKGKAKNGALFVTTVLGNSNAGHEYGTHLSDEDRRAVIEFLKTL